MLSTLTDVTVLKVTTRDVTSPEGADTTFASITVLSGFDTVTLWAFAKDFITLPAQGDIIDAAVYTKAKTNDRNPQYPRLSSQLKSYSAK